MTQKQDYNKNRELLAKQGDFRHVKEIDNSDKNTIHLPRHSRFTINHTFVYLGKTGHNMAESLANTTVSTTKAHRGRCRIVKEIGRNP